MEAKNIFSKKANRKGWNHNTELSVNLKTILGSDRSMKTSKDFSLKHYAFGVYNEICLGVAGPCRE